MKKIIICLHTSADGFVAGPNGEMDWIKLDDEMFDYVGKFTDEADTALYGRVTYQMMDSYWPTAADSPNASKHDIQHSRWYNKVDKVIISRTLKDKKQDKTIFIGDNIPAQIENIKNRPGSNILIFGSPSVAHVLMKHNLIDEYWLFVNPVILGKGIPTFTALEHKIALNPLETKVFSCGVTALHYSIAK